MGNPGSGGATARRFHNLPPQLTSFVGREREISSVGGLLVGDATPLVTLAGPGGAGKTRLAAAISRHVAEDFADGVWWVGLAQLSDPDLVPQAVAEALDVLAQPGVPLAQTLSGALREMQLLLVLDNCEHLIGACADLAQDLLVSCPDMQILATSRESLGVAGETIWQVPSLDTPDASTSTPSDAARYEAVELFVERARSRLQSFALTAENAPAVARVCRKLDGIPLAIELAAARVPVLSVDQISERLDDPLALLSTGDRTAEPRQRTLRATLEWSYGLLEEEEIRLYERLSVFAGGWTLEAAEAVGASNAPERGAVLDLLSGLVYKSVVVADAGHEPRYKMLEPVRQYGLERLEESGGSEATRERHAALFLALAEEAHPELRGPRQVEWMGRLGRENDNLRAALAWSLSRGDRPTAAQLGWALWPYWWYRGQHREGHRLMQAALAGDLPPELRIRATVAAAVMAYGQADIEPVVQYMEDLLQLSREVGGNTYAEAYASAGMGLVAMNRGDFDGARVHLEESLPLLLECGEVWTASQAHTWIGTTQLLEGDHAGAASKFEDGLALAWEIGDRTGIYNALFALAGMALAAGDPDAAGDRFSEAMALSEEMGDRANAAYCLEGLAAVAGARGAPKRSARLFGAAEKLLETIGVPVWTFYKPDRALYENAVAGLRAQLGEAALSTSWSEGRAMTPERAVSYAAEGDDAPAPSAVALPAGLSAREAEVLKLVANGLTNAQVANALSISPRTVNRHMNSVYAKIGTSLRPEAVRFAADHGLL